MATWVLALAYIASMKEKPMMSTCGIVRRDILHKSMFYLFGRIVVFSNKPKPVAYPEHMCVYSHCRFAEPYGKHDICCFASDTRQRGKLLYSIGHDTMEIGDKLACHFYKVTCLAVRITNTPYVFKNIVNISLGHVNGFGKMRKERWCDHVYSVVGTLCA